MDVLKICFIGIGSVAKRHIRNLTQVCHDRGLGLHMEALRRSGGDMDGIEKVYADGDALPNDYDAIFITNPTEVHLTSLQKFHNNGKHFFIEKPVVTPDQIDEANRFIPRPDSVYYVACPLRYNAVIQYIKQKITPEDVISVRSISSSYLPDWRPGQDYRDTYSAHKDMGGGVSIDLIHEWDYLTYLFGWPDKVSSMIGRKSSLKIDSDDYAIYIAEYANMIAELHLDYFGRKTIREVELFTKEDTIIGDIANNKIVFQKSGEVIDFHEERDDYQKRELNHFLDVILGEATMENSFEHGISVLKLTQGRWDKYGANIG